MACELSILHEHIITTRIDIATLGKIASISVSISNVTEYSPSLANISQRLLEDTSQDAWLDARTYLDELDADLATLYVRLVAAVAETAALYGEGHHLIVCYAAPHALVDVQVLHNCVISIQHHIKHLTIRWGNGCEV